LANPSCSYFALLIMPCVSRTALALLLAVPNPILCLDFGGSCTPTNQVTSELIVQLTNYFPDTTGHARGADNCNHPHWRRRRLSVNTDHRTTAAAHQLWRCVLAHNGHGHRGGGHRRGSCASCQDRGKYGACKWHHQPLPSRRRKNTLLRLLQGRKRGEWVGVGRVAHFACPVALVKPFYAGILDCANIPPVRSPCCS
jgi:hypothetical protein